MRSLVRCAGQWRSDLGSWFSGMLYSPVWWGLFVLLIVSDPGIWFCQGNGLSFEPLPRGSRSQQALSGAGNRAGEMVGSSLYKKGFPTNLFLYGWAVLAFTCLTVTWWMDAERAFWHYYFSASMHPRISLGMKQNNRISDIQEDQGESPKFQIFIMIYHILTICCLLYY